jgi:hypothetical protein
MVLMVYAHALALKMSASGLSLHSWSFGDVLAELQMQVTNLL